MFVFTDDGRQQRLLLAAMIFAAFTAIAFWSVANGSVYDDEVFSIQHVNQKGVLSLVQFMNSGDVHPPGAYVINRWLWDILHKWDRVKIADGIINGLGLSFFFAMAYPHLKPRERLYLGFLLASAATWVMWGTSVRWYAYYNPLVAVTYGVLLFSGISCNARSIFLCAMAVVLFHINYVTFCAVPTFLAIHLVREWRRFREQPKDLWLLVGAGIAALLICVPQLIVFFTVHFRTDSPQQGSVGAALVRVFMTMGLGNAVFPIAALPILVIISLAAGCTFALIRRPLTSLEKAALIALLLGMAAMTLTGLGIRPRNSTWLLPLVWFLVASLLAKLPRLAQSAAVILVTVFQLVGVRNAIAHQSTIKGSYNTDFPAVMRKLNSWKDKCPSLFVFNHDVVLTEMLRETGGAQSSPYLMGAPDREHFPVGACYVVVKTYHEPFDVRAVNAFYNGVQTKSASRVDAADISVDIDYKAKSWIRHESFAPFLVHLDLYRVVRPVVMGRWKFPGWTRSSGGV